MLIEKQLVKTDNTTWATDDIDDSVECENSVYLVPRASLIRRLCYNISKHKYFDNSILVLIALSSLKLATDTYMTGFD